MRLAYRGLERALGGNCFPFAKEPVSVKVTHGYGLATSSSMIVH